jgi:hypothetical protein
VSARLMQQPGVWVCRFGRDVCRTTRPIPRPSAWALNEALLVVCPVLTCPRFRLHICTGDAFIIPAQVSASALWRWRSSGWCQHRSSACRGASSGFFSFLRPSKRPAEGLAERKPVLSVGHGSAVKKLWCPGLSAAP